MSPCVCVLFILFQLWTADGRQQFKRHAGPGDPIVYPGPVKKVLPDSIDVPEECKHKTYCHIKPNNYPQEAFDSMFIGKKIASQPELVLPPDLADRYGDEQEDGCRAEITHEPIYLVHTGETGWRTVVQAPRYNYTQKIRLEKCLNEESSCFSIFPKVPDYTTFCKQKYGVWEVLVSDQSGTHPIKTQLPICCSCYYKQTEKQ